MFVIEEGVKKEEQFMVYERLSENQEQGLLSEAWFAAGANLELARVGDVTTRKRNILLHFFITRMVVMKNTRFYIKE